MKLQELYSDKESLEEIKAYLAKYLTAWGVEKMFNGENVLGVCEAKKIIDGAFDNLDQQFGSKVKERKEPVNEAR